MVIFPHQIRTQIESILKNIERLSLILNEYNESGQSSTLINLNKGYSYPLGEILTDHSELLSALPKLSGNVNSSMLSELEAKWDEFQTMINQNRDIITIIAKKEIEHDIEILEGRIINLDYRLEGEYISDTFYIRSIVYENVKLLNLLNNMDSEYIKRIEKIDTAIRTNKKHLWHIPNSWEEIAPEEYWWYRL